MCCQWAPQLVERESRAQSMLCSPGPSQTLSVNRSALPHLITLCPNSADWRGRTVAAIFPQWKFFRQLKAMWSPYLFLHCSHRIALHWSAIDLPRVLYWKRKEEGCNQYSILGPPAQSHLTVWKKKEMRHFQLSALSVTLLLVHTTYCMYACWILIYAAPVQRVTVTVGKDTWRFAL